jgi:predicted metal-dependent hydrolase
MHQIEVHGLLVDVVRKDIKNLHLAVYPPAGRVRVAAPLRVNDEAVRMVVVSKFGWIQRQQRKFVGQERQARPEYVNGESHYFLGTRYLLNVVEGSRIGGVVIRNKKRLDLRIQPGSTRAQRERVMLRWYRAYLRQAVPPLIRKWQTLMGVNVAEWRIKQMKTKWGTCNIPKRRLWVNLELAKKSEKCLDYVILHEMVHLLERLHNEKFAAYMSRYMPRWQFRRQELNRAPLGHVTWEY